MATPIDIVAAVGLADAVGLPYEGRYSHEIKDYVGTFPYKTPCRDFPLNDWSDDTDQSVCLWRAYTATGGDAAFEKAFALQLHNWVNKGFPELGDEYGAGCGAHTHRVVCFPGFVADPLRTASSNQMASAGNGSLMRTALTSLTPRELDLAARQSRVTHPDPRCVGACVFLDELLRATPSHPAEIDVKTSLKAAFRRSRPYFGDYWDETLNWVRRAGNLDNLALDEREARGYVLKTMAVSIWSYLRMAALSGRGEDPAKFYKSVVLKIVRRGGDADTNAAVAMAAFGKYLRVEKLPEDWLSTLPHLDWMRTEMSAGIGTTKKSPTS